MNIKKIFGTAIILSLISSGLFYVSFLREKPQSVATTAPVVKSQVVKAAEKKVETGLKIEKGKRAISISVDSAKGVAGYITVGDYVDVATIYEDKNQSTDPKAPKKVVTGKLGTIVVQNVKVIGLGTAVQTEEEKKSYDILTLQVTPEEGLALGMAKLNEFYVMLRGEGDKDASTPVHMNDDVIEKGVKKANE